jgi:hypothetical protein
MVIDWDSAATISSDGDFTIKSSFDFDFLQKIKGGTDSQVVLYGAK